MNLAEFEAKLNIAIVDVLEKDVAGAVRDEISRHLKSYAYTHSRGPDGMGVRDRRNFQAAVEQSGDTSTLRVTDVAKFQSSNQPSKSLAEVVETGDPAYNMPGPRPFIAPTQETMDAGLDEALFRNGLNKRGFKVNAT